MSFPTYTQLATWAMISGTAHADYPVTNLGDLRKPRTPLITTAPGAIAFSGVLPADQSVQLVALCHHNAEVGETYRIQLYSDAGMTTGVADSGTLVFPVHPEGLYPQVTPYVLPAALTVRAVRVDLSAQAAAWQVGAVELGGFWDLTHHDARSMGVQTKDGVTSVGRGVDHATRRFSPRLATIGNSLIDTATEGATFSDFVTEKGSDLPFVYVRDADDSATFTRECFLGRLSGHSYSKNAAFFGDIGLSVVEHLR